MRQIRVDFSRCDRYNLVVRAVGTKFSQLISVSFMLIDLNGTLEAMQPSTK